MCGTMIKDRKLLILAVGGYFNSNGLADCEYTELPNIEWKKCLDLPMPLYGAQLIEDPETGDVLLLGGTNGPTIQNTIYRLSDINGNWTLQEKTLQAARYDFSAMLVPPGILNCEKSSSKHDEL